jgi:hypothetical protein
MVAFGARIHSVNRAAQSVMTIAARSPSPHRFRSGLSAIAIPLFEPPAFYRTTTRDTRACIIVYGVTRGTCHSGSLTVGSKVRTDTVSKPEIADCRSCDVLQIRRQ